MKPSEIERALLNEAWEAWLAVELAAGRRVGNLVWCREAFFRNMDAFVSARWRYLWRSIPTVAPTTGPHLGHLLVRDVR